ncbi:hypothetical protein EVAR_8790_1 [Eumeta japonica]|uniref:Uncharacterized protein n=1 Tax=Eumeta variegata TaxID=151549 RepID=A0A4C1TTT3_EUMVA|nr:hypothetical protein EVAR_8790_1 [Eumeta japonica]
MSLAPLSRVSRRFLLTACAAEPSGVVHFLGWVKNVKLASAHVTRSKTRKTEGSRPPARRTRGSDIPLSFYRAEKMCAYCCCCLSGAGRLRELRVCLYYSLLRASADGDC